MPFTVLIFGWRKPGLSPAAFKSHFESNHVPLVRELTGNLFPQQHRRHYIQRSATQASEDTSNAAHQAKVLVGDQADFDYDGFTELVFADEAAFKAFVARMGEPDVKAKVERDEERFLNRTCMKIAVVDEVNVTTGST